jgi:trehalose transport system substrate-binding protein
VQKLKSALILILAFYLLSSCSKKEEVTLRVVMGLAEDEWQVINKEIFPIFEKRYNCKIEAYQVEAVDWLKKLKAMVKADKVNVDVFAQDNMRLYALVKNELVEDLSEYVRQIPKEVIPPMIKVGEFDGKTYFFPYRPNVQIVFYNEDKFKKYNLKTPRNWEELLKVAKAFKEREKVGRVGLKLWGDGPTTTLIYEMIASAGGNPFQFNDEGCIKTFQFLQELYPYLSPDSKKAKWDTTNTYLANESFYLAQNWPFAINIIVQEYGKKEIKAYQGWAGPLREAHVIGGEVLGIPRGAKNKNLALKFILFLESKEIQEKLVARLGWPSIRSDAYAEVATWQKPYFKAIKRALKFGIYRPNVSYWGEFDKFLNEAITRIMIKQEAVVPVLNEYHFRMKEIINAYKNAKDL